MCCSWLHYRPFYSRRTVREPNFRWSSAKLTNLYLLLRCAFLRKKKNTKIRNLFYVDKGIRLQNNEEIAWICIDSLALPLKRDCSVRSQRTGFPIHCSDIVTVLIWTIMSPETDGLVNFHSFYNKKTVL